MKSRKKDIQDSNFYSISGQVPGRYNSRYVTKPVVSHQIISQITLGEERSIMFIKTSVFKRILKDAWKGAGLTVGKKEEMYFIQGAYWICLLYTSDAADEL